MRLRVKNNIKKNLSSSMFWWGEFVQGKVVAWVWEVGGGEVPAGRNIFMTSDRHVFSLGIEISSRDFLLQFFTCLGRETLTQICIRLSLLLITPEEITNTCKVIQQWNKGDSNSSNCSPLSSKQITKNFLANMLYFICVVVGVVDTVRGLKSRIVHLQRNCYSFRQL